jgi:hypothetical protein
MLITVMVGGKTHYDKDGTPSNVGGRLTVMDTRELEERKFVQDHEFDAAHVTEYWEGDQLRHRSVEVKIKTNHPAWLQLQAQLGELNKG